MIRFDAKIRASFSQEGQFFGRRVAATETRGAGSISREYGEAIRGRFYKAMRPALGVFNGTVLASVWVPKTGTPVWTGRLLSATYSTFNQSVPNPIRGGRVSWFIIANTHYAALVNATASRRRRPNYLGRAVNRAIPRATQRAADVFAQNLN